MADELAIITENAADDGWVDLAPGAVSSGYQAQNTAIDAMLIGTDKSEVTASGLDVIVEPSGPIDVTKTTLNLRSVGTHYIRVTGGSAWNRRTLETTGDEPAYDRTKKGLYRDGERYLNWIIYRDSSESRPFRIMNPEQEKIRIENFLDINGLQTTLASGLQFSPGEKQLHYRRSIIVKGTPHSLFLAFPAQSIGGTYRLRFHYALQQYTIYGAVSVRRKGKIIENLIARSGEGDIFERDLYYGPGEQIELWGESRGFAPDRGGMHVSTILVKVAELPSRLMRFLMKGEGLGLDGAV